MKSEQKNTAKVRAYKALIFAFGVGVPLLPQGAMAALTDISNTPIATAASTQVAPNIMFVLDDSGSMAWAHMTDAAKALKDKVGYKNYLCNGLYYNPSRTYEVPVNSDGTEFSGTQLKAWPLAWYNGFDSNDGTVDLSKNFRAYDGTTGDGGSDTTQPAYYYKWNGTVVAGYDGNGDLDGDGNNDCNDNSSSSFPHTTGQWEKVQLNSASDTEKQNFANWFSYYRTRMLLMKTASGRAFTALDDHFRVGFLTICPGSGCTSVSASKFLKIDEFTPTHKADWYAKFYKQDPTSNTPLRQALSRVGRYFAHKTDGINAGISDDPIQYSCQKNFTILTTDGNWNTGPGVKLDGSAMDNQDSDLALTPPPMFDGGPVSAVVTTTKLVDHYGKRSKAGKGKPACSGSEPNEATLTHQQFITTVSTNQNGATSTKNDSKDSGSTNVCVSGNPPYDIDMGTSSTSGNVGSGGQGNTLADVAEYYYRTDLRPDGSLGSLGTDVGTGGSGKDVPPSGSGLEDDKAPHQHMTTFTLGLGVSGQLKFDPFYRTATTGDFQAIRNGTKGWPLTNPTNTTGSTTDQLARIDDLWHAAVNGRGTAFSAADADTLQASLQTALANIQASVGSSAAAATSSLTPTVTNNLIFGPKYTTGKWKGELEAQRIDLSVDADGKPSASYGTVLPAITWSASTQLDTRTKANCDSRNIKLFHSGATDNLVDFSWDTKQCDGSGSPTGSSSTGLDSTEQGYFSNAQVAQLSHAPLMTDGSSGTADQLSPAKGANLVNYIRGQRGLEGFIPNDASKLYRARETILGDIVHSQPVYVGASGLKYGDTGYTAFKAATASRTPMVYVGANDGMLHAFTAGTNAANYADGGVEKWAFIPHSVLPRLFKLADNNWSSLHEYFVDAKPIVGDIYDGTAWKTILVGGLAKGGRAYYALDITDPAHPKALWEFAHDPALCFSGSGNFYSDCHMGYSVASPIITKLADGTWVVLVTSGYNNVNVPAKAGDGKGYLYVLDAATGKLLKKISTGVGDATTPSGLSNIRNWTLADASVNATTTLVYGADLLGNIFRFDINSASPAATLVTTLKDPSGNPQPITTRLGLAEVGTPPSPYIFAATGRYLGTSDVADNQVQSVYGIKDTGAVISNPRSTLMKLSISTSAGARHISCGSNCTSQAGWMVDLPDAGERVSVDMQLQFGMLVVGSNVPSNTACSPGGYSWVNYFDMQSGLSPFGVGQTMGYSLTSMLVGLTIVKLPNDQPKGFARGSDGTTSGIDIPPLFSGGGKRVSWREIGK